MCDIACVNINGYEGCHIGSTDDLVEIMMRKEKHKSRATTRTVIYLYVEDKVAFKNLMDSCLEKINNCHHNN